MVAKHRRRGHDVSSLHDLRNLDLEQIHAVRGRASSWLYPTGAALSGAGAGLAISGGELVTAVSGGAGAAPSGAVIAGAFVGDAAAVLALSTRAVGRSALMHGYDPESPAEKLFILSVVNAGSAVSASAKTAAFTDISKLTQALARGKSWEVLNETVVAKVAGEFAKRFSFRLTKQGLGKVVPAAGIVLGGTLNWATLEGIVDAADIAYRRRFLLEKYPQLAESDSFGKAAALDANIPEDADEAISVVDEIAEAIGQPPA
ncbi:MAG TPA: EcsC family protein [Rhodoglobus sp.]|nr:EcsC family protein [Rhodoglobus sp.]